MKKGLLVTMFLVSLMSSGEALSDGFQYNVGLKIWFSTYGYEAPNNGGYRESHVTDTLGVSLGARMQKWIAGYNYLSAEYRFEDTPNSISRHENDIYIGYYLHPRVAVLAGLKYLLLGWWDGDKFDYVGPAIGVTAFVPTNVLSTYVYTNLSYVWLKDYDWDIGLTSPVFELGISGIVPRFTSWSYSLAYKFQIYDGEAHDQLEVRDIRHHEVSGVVFGIMYSF